MGKYAQSTVDSINENIHGFTQFSKIKFDTTIDPKTLRFRHIKGDKTKENFKYNRNYNIWIASAVTAHARTRFNRQMIKIWSRTNTIL